MRTLIALLYLVFITSVVHGAWTQESRNTDNSRITLSTVTLRVREMIDDPNSASGTVRYSSNTIYGLVNTAQRLMCINTMALTSWATQQLVADTTEYILPGDCLAIERVTINENANANGLEEYIPFKTIHHLDADQGKQWNIVSASQSPTAYYIRNRYLGVYPVPNNTGAVIRIEYIKIPALMDSEDDYIFDGYTPLECYYEALAAYAAHQLLLQEGRTTNLETLSSIYAGALEAIKGWIRFRPEMQEDITGATY